MQEMQGNFKAYDAVLDDVKYEFKAEKLIKKYGNICIEYACSGKPSGITTTEADVYLIMSIVDDSIEECWKIPVQIIREKIASKMYHRDTRGGAGHAAQMYLFRKDVFSAWRV